MQGTIVRVTGVKVILLRSNPNKEIAVPIAALSAKDQQYIQEWNKRQTAGNATRPQKESSAYWSKAAASIRKHVPFEPLLIDGIPVGNPPSELVAPEKRKETQTASLQIACLMLYAENPQLLEQIAQAVEKTGRDNSASLLFFAALKGLFSQAEQMQIQQAQLEANRNPLTRNQALAKLYRQVNARLKSAYVKADSITSWGLTKVSLGSLDREASTAKLKRRGEVFPGKWGYSQDLPNVDQMRLNQEQVNLFSRVSQASNLYIRTQFTLKGGRATVNEVGLVSGQDLNRTLYRWPIQSGPTASAVTDSAILSADSSDLKTKMQIVSKQHGLETFEGFPVLFTDNSTSIDSNYKPYIQRFSSMLDRIALAEDPGFLNPRYVVRYFSEAVGRYVEGRRNANGVVGRAQWLGKDDFERRGSQEKFLEAYAQKIAAHGIKLPVRFQEVITVRLGHHGTYDFDRKGFLSLIHISEPTRPY